MARPRLAHTAALALIASAATGAAGAVPNEGVERAEPQSVTLTTKDGVLLQCMFYPGSGKESAPLILIHGWQGPRGAGSGRDYDRLAEGLQAAGYAVIAPDMRGHGGSRLRRSTSGVALPLRRERFGTLDFAAMVTQDLEAVKQFLVRQHNDGKLNIELLCVVGADFGAVVAANWAVRDWSWPVLPNLKQGQDVKALVLISPLQTFKNYLSLQKALRYKVLHGMPTLMIYGEKDEDFDREAQRIHKQAQRFHGRSGITDTQTLQLVGLPTTLQGTKLLTVDLHVLERIQVFLRDHVQSQRNSFPWHPRNLP